MNYMDERHLRKFELLAVQQQQRIMKNLEKSARKRAKGNTVNREQEEGRADGYNPDSGFHFISLLWVGSQDI